MLARPTRLDHDDAPRRATALARIAVLTDVAEAQRDWDHMVARAPCSPYQTPAWLEPWLQALGASLEPAFVTGYAASGEPIAFLALGIARQAGLRVASFLGGKDANTGLGLFDPAATFDVSLLDKLLRTAARRARVDLYVLRNQPAAWAGIPNPMAALPQHVSPSCQHEAALERPAARFFARIQSGKTRKRLRQKETKLASLGDVRHERAATADATIAIIDAYLRQSADRFGSQPERSEDLRRFLTQASVGSGDRPAALACHALTLDGRIIATFIAASHAGRLSGMGLSYDPEGPWAKFSPGELLVGRVEAAACEDGLETFDLGIGEARYKDVFCPRVEPLFDTILGMTPRGRVAARAWGAHLAAKRVVKQTPWIWAGFLAGRRWVDRLSGGFATR